MQLITSGLQSVIGEEVMTAMKKYGTGQILSDALAAVAFRSHVHSWAQPGEADYRFIAAEPALHK